MKLHPLTAVRDAVSHGTRLASFGLFGALAGSAAGVLPTPAAYLLVPLGLLAGGAYGVARYAAFEYELSGDTLEIRSGVFQRQRREIPLPRVQNVDVEESFLQRLFGVAVVRFETAGGGETEGELALVDHPEAERLQAELRAHRRQGRREGDVEGSKPGEPTALFELSPPELFVLAAVSFRWGVLPVLGIGYPLFEDQLFDLVQRLVVPVLLGGSVSLADPRLLAVALGGVAVYLLLTWVVSGAITVVRYHGFRLARIDDELVYERGLLQRYSGTIPLDKVQALTVEENVPMRRLGYAALTIETAGYAPGSDGGGSPSAIPLADRETVVSLVEEIEGVDDLAVERPPRRARRRYAGRYALVALAVGAAVAAVHLLVWPPGVLWALPAALLVAAPVGAHLKWTHLGHRVDDRQFLARAGFWRRRTTVVPHYRLQTVLTVRTVFQRRWGLASVVGDTASSSTLRSLDATAHDLDLGTARALHRRLRERLQSTLARRRAARQRVDDAVAQTPTESEPSGDAPQTDDGGQGTAAGGEQADDAPPRRGNGTGADEDANGTGADEKEDGNGTGEDEEEDGDGTREGGDQPRVGSGVDDEGAGPDDTEAG